MKKLLFILCVLFCSCSKSQIGGVNITPIRSIFLMAGESNVGGRGLNTLATVAEKLQRTSSILNNITLRFEKLQVGVNNNLCHDGYGFGPGTLSTLDHGWELQFANQVDSLTLQAAPIYIVKAGQGGSVISQWDSTDSKHYWDSLTRRLDTAITQLTKINQGKPPNIYLFYSQGINDVEFALTDTLTWKTKTETLFARIRARYGHVPVFMTYLPTQYPTYNTTITRIASEVTEVFPIQVSDATLFNADHWDYEGLKLIARRMIAALKANYTL